jgi:hypothetical protein
LVGVLKCWTQFWKRTTQESFQQSFVEIGSVVSERKILEKRGDGIKKKYSPLKLLSQSPPNFAEMILR